MHLRRTSRRRQWWRTANELDEPPQVLRGCGEQHLVSRAAQASQSKPVQPENALHMRKSHLDLLAFAACTGICAAPVPLRKIGRSIQLKLYRKPFAQMMVEISA